MKVLYVLPVKGGGGGAHSVAQEVNELVKMGISAQIAVNQKNFASFVTCYSDMPNVSRNVVEFTDEKSLAALLNNVDSVVCTIFTSVKLVKDALTITKSKPKVSYYAQDYEPLFVQPADPMWQEAFDSYTLIPNMTVFAKTDWIRNVITANHGIEVSKVSPSIDHDVYYPGLNKSQTQVWISAMIRPSTPRRAPQRTMRVLKNIAEEFGNKVNINVFGCTDEDIFTANLPSDFDYTNHGVLSRNQVSALLRKSHLFIDLSDYQAFGRTGLEAMACGCVSLVPSTGGTDEYIKHNENGFAIDPRDEKSVASHVSSFITLENTNKKELAGIGISTSLEFSVRRATLSVLTVIGT
ncbi:glycosyltransferase [Alteromonas mediterranea]|uniref:Glycosyl transferase n=1 Tax=Alteromonas mediterranea TaxID=314275 RepID=A0AAC9F7J2_9ALTE|nr:glycosyltransferase [Alteromonas mediterranea]MBR9785131.1 glycosyltransferase [Gammaproteobacteria bacterium]RPH19061.1 MAG: glycosyltransferase [Alteromonadaceae bacterium TMED7]AFV87022.1 bifunctional methyltransferase/glycosyl transferase [Alteromonas mediterranea DE1]AGP99036.1 bifunctional methyltransferase/glycosyl transferase [Alteromonas mediterranea UM7]AMJ79941.1 glycosyl transferase [Alteromonas mediterranea]|tara:strand:+ start:3452 stop:4507 length:1056 start_codon:yes stop_codon:yes gene_type:complete